MLAQRLDGVCRAGGRKAAAGGLKGRDAELIEANQHDKRPDGDALKCFEKPLPESCGLHARWFYIEGAP